MEWSELFELFFNKFLVLGCLGGFLPNKFVAIWLYRLWFDLFDKSLFLIGIVGKIGMLFWIVPKGILTFNEFVRQAYTSIFDIFALFGVPYAVLKLRLDLTDFFDTDLPFGLTMCDLWLF